MKMHKKYVSVMVNNYMDLKSQALYFVLEIYDYEDRNQRVYEQYVYSVFYKLILFLRCSSFPFDEAINEL